jgi:glucose-6-phosphate isomerase
MRAHLPRIETFTSKLIKDGFTHVLLLGMGGSSLAPYVFKQIFKVKEGFLDLEVLDSTHPDEVKRHTENLNPGETLFIVSTKSGGTVETISFFKYFYNWILNQLGETQAGNHFVAITDPGSKLEALARELDFREIFLNNTNIGGRYSALSFFGLVPASLLGIDIYKLLDRVDVAVSDQQSSSRLGTIIGELAKQGRDKLTFVFPDQLASLGDWIEQLIAESTGKEGRGILPIVGEPLGDPGSYGTDRVFITIDLGDGSSHAREISSLVAAGHPCIEMVMDDIYDLGAQFFLWELSTVVASYWLQINPFDQPNVESAKVLARKMVASYQSEGSLPDGDSTPYQIEELLGFLSNAKAGDYIAIQAYLQPTHQVRNALNNIRIELRNQFKLATTLGFGPRFLHSTGQLHKGDSGNGLFIQFTSDPQYDVPIPDAAGQFESAMTFGTLILAQALGDQQALQQADRRVLHFHLSPDPVADLLDLYKSLANE